MVQAVLTDTHPRYRATALTEANAFGSAGGVLTPLLIGGLQALAVGWRAGIYTMVALWGLIMVVGLREPIPSAQRSEHTAAPLTPLQNLTFGLIFFGAAAEWVTIAWGADLMTASLGLQPSIASTLLIAYFAANAMGRWAVSQMTATRPLHRLLAAVLLVGGVGFVVFWRVGVPWLSVAGLFVAGVGIANFFPLGLALVMTDAHPQQVDLISTRTSLAAGSAILLAPQVTGLLADAVGIQAAVATVPLAIVMMALLLAVRLRLR
jgi:predicted MFS family arabinose efflux permease